MAAGQDRAGPITPDSSPITPAGRQAAVPTEVKQAVLDQFQADFPEAAFYVSETREMGITRVWGATFGYGAAPQDAAEQFRANYSRMFGVRAEDLLPVGPSEDGRHTQPLGWNPETGEYKFTLVYYSQYLDGLPVFRSGMKLLTRNEANYPLVWAGSSLRDLGAFRVGGALYDAEAGRRAAMEKIPSLVNFTDPEAVVWAGTADTIEAPVTAMTFTADNDGSPLAQQLEKWLFVTDAATGAILYQENRIIFTDVTGNVSGMATTGPKSDNCAAEASTAMKYAKVSIGSTTAYANASGNFTIPNGGTSPVTVTSYMAGLYFMVDNVAGAEETLTLSVTPPGPANFVHNLENTSEAIRAQVNGYVQANVVRDFCLTYNPSYPTIASQLNFPVYVNRTDGYCPGNAWYDGSAINFCSSSSPYPNTAWSNIIHHEYGHHMVQMAGSGQDEYGEGMSDCVAMLIADDPICGYGFDGDCNAGIRDADNTMQYPCSGEIHYCGQLISGCVWSTRNELAVTNPGSYLSIISNLTVDSILLHTGGTITPQIYADFITLDGGTGGPHYSEITNGFAAHNMVPVLPPANDACANAIVACPGNTYPGNTNAATVDGSASCGTSGSTPDVWYMYTPATNGSATFSLCGSGTTYDSVLSVHTGTCPGSSSNEAGCDDDGCGGSGAPSTVTVSVTQGTLYRIRISGWSGAKGAYSFSITGPACQGDIAPPTPNPMTFDTLPTPNTATPTTMLDMVATTASDPTTPVQYAFEANTGPAYPGADARTWGAGRTYSDTGLTPNTTYVYRAKARDGATPQNETIPSADASAVTYIQTPTGVLFGTVTSNSVVLNATGTLTNLTVSSSGVYFDSTTSGGDGGINAWVQASTDTATGLAANTLYTFQAKARNQSAVETPYSGPASKWTLALVPTVPTLGSPTTTTMTLNVNPNGNPAATTFAIRCTAANPADATWASQYVDALGDPSTTAVWQTDAEWGTITVNGLQPNTTYTFAVKARNGDGVETVFGPGASLATQALTGGACCNPSTGNCTITTQAACVSGGGVYQGNFTTCTPNPCAQPCLTPGDINVDGWVNGLDIAGFVRAKLGQAPLPGENPACADYGNGDLNLDIADFVAALIG